MRETVNGKVIVKVKLVPSSENESFAIVFRKGERSKVYSLLNGYEKKAKLIIKP